MSLTVSNAAGTDTETKTGFVTVTAPAGAQPDAWDPATMLGADLEHPNDTGMTYLADCYEWALADAGKTPAAGALLTAYGDSWTAMDHSNTPGLRAIEQRRDRLSLTLTNQAVAGYKAGDCAARAIGTTGTFVAGTGGLVLVQAGFNDLLQADTAQQRTATANYLRALFAVLCAAERIEETAFTLGTGWGAVSLTQASGGGNRATTTEGASATYTVTTPGTYYFLTFGTDGTSNVGGEVTISQGATTLAVLDLNQQVLNTGTLLTSGWGNLSVRLDNVQAGTLTVTYSNKARSGAAGWLDALVRVSPTPPTILAVKPVEAPNKPERNKPALLDYIRDLYDTLAAEFGANVVVCDPDPSWTP